GIGQLNIEKPEKPGIPRKIGAQRSLVRPQGCPSRSSVLQEIISRFGFLYRIKSVSDFRKRFFYLHD
ncbi:hypothetical protein, partial [Negativibacillus massiliensis]|uniref:hypothetical protein n=1 Tax=Negativibacillus massiliensis TaxID=1871035 RepID=UPI0023F7506F